VIGIKYRGKILGASVARQFPKLAAFINARSEWNHAEIGWLLNGNVMIKYLTLHRLHNYSDVVLFNPLVQNLHSALQKL